MHLSREELVQQNRPVFDVVTETQKKTCLVCSYDHRFSPECDFVCDNSWITVDDIQHTIDSGFTDITLRGDIHLFGNINGNGNTITIQQEWSSYA